jgi:hypothetical protein
MKFTFTMLQSPISPVLGTTFSKGGKIIQECLKLHLDLFTTFFTTLFTDALEISSRHYQSHYRSDLFQFCQILHQVTNWKSLVRGTFLTNVILPVPYKRNYSPNFSVFNYYVTCLPCTIISTGLMLRLYHCSDYNLFRNFIYKWWQLK